VKIFRSWFLENLWFQFFFATAFAAGMAFLCYIEVLNLNDFITPKISGTLFSTLASIFGSLLGFVITAAAIVISFLGSPSMSVLKKSAHFPKLWKIFFATSRALGVSTVFALACIIDDVTAALGPITVYILIALCILTFLRVISCLWVLEKVVELQQLQTP